MSQAKVIKVVEPDMITGFSMSLTQIFGLGPKWTITCGNCGVTFTKRLKMVSQEKIPCPHCDVLNKLDLFVS